MRKAFSLALVLAVAMMFATGAYAGENCGAKKTAEKASAKSDCSAHKTTEAKMVSDDHAGCAGHKAGEAKMTGVDKHCVGDPSFCTPEDCAAWHKMCEAHGENAEIRMMSVKGMTCGGCENSIKAALTETAGVLDVAKVDHKRGVAVVIVDKSVAKNDVLTTTVTNKGYEAAIIPAVATTSTDAKAQQSSGKLDCAKTCAKPCDKAKKAAEGTSTPH